MKRVINPHAEIHPETLKKWQSMVDVVSASCVATDAQERENVMKSYMKQRSVNKTFVGPALTVKLSPGNIVDCLPIFEIAKPGDVVVIDAFGESETSIWGGLMSGLARAAGIVGAVIDGSARDTDEAKMLDFPVTTKSVSPRAAHSAYTNSFDPIEINVPVVCGGVQVSPGDIVVCDEIGVTIVPLDQADEIYVKAREQADKEEATRKDILAGFTVDQLLDKYGRI
jgi:regulator of RNase E activity RraA